MKFHLQASSQTIPYITAGLALLVLFFVGWQTPKIPNTNVFGRCPAGQILFEANTFGYSLCFPASWAGRYEVSISDRIINFSYKGEENPGAVLFSIRSVPRVLWDQDNTMKSVFTEIGRDGEQVFGYKIGENAKDLGGEVLRMSEESRGVAQNIAFSSYKSIEQAIDEFITRKAVISSGGKPFASFEFLGRDDLGDKLKYYVWAYSEEYSFARGVLYKGANMSVPIVVIVAKSPNGYLVEGAQVPRGGAYFSEDMKAYFPERIIESEWFSSNLVYLNEHVKLLGEVTRAKAREHFKISKTLDYGFIRGFPGKDGRTYITVDRIEFLSGESALRAMQKVGMCSSDQPCIAPAQQMVFNEKEDLAEYVVSPNIGVTMFSGAGAKNVSFAELVALFATSSPAHTNTLFSFVLEGGVVYEIVEQPK